MAEITSTFDMAEDEWGGDGEPNDVDTDMVATTDPTDQGIEFHVSMRSYTLRDMEGLIIDAAARQIVGRHGETEIRRSVEEKALQLISEKAAVVLSGVTAEIIDQPLTPSFGDKQPVTMREFLGLYGREFLSERVDRDGKPTKASDGWGRPHSLSRMEWLVGQHLTKVFRDEITKATNAVISEIQAAIRADHKAFLEAEKARVREALTRSVGAA